MEFSKAKLKSNDDKGTTLNAAMYCIVSGTDVRMEKSTLLFQANYCVT
jgi:hypothetical protein